LQRVRPDLLIVDWSLVAVQPAELLSGLRQLYPSLRILALSVHKEVCEVALASGADSFVGKGDAVEQVVRVLRALGGITQTNQEDAL
jgi:DNA-binding NarL/FixJ family response regulator